MFPKQVLLLRKPGNIRASCLYYCQINNFMDVVLLDGINDSQTHLITQKNIEKTCNYKKSDSQENIGDLKVNHSSRILRMSGIFYLLLCELPPELL